MSGCDCPALCPHGVRCSGSHSDPDNHWWSLCDSCFTPDATGWPLKNGQYIFVVADCSHAVGPGPVAAISRLAAEHRRTCPQ